MHPEVWCIQQFGLFVMMFGICIVDEYMKLYCGDAIHCTFIFYFSILITKVNKKPVKSEVGQLYWFYIGLNGSVNKKTKPLPLLI
jgi:hypothetical protein